MKTFEQLAAEKYPIYTGQKKNPETGKPDCPLTVRFKLLARADFVKKMKRLKWEWCDRKEILQEDGEKKWSYVSKLPVPTSYKLEMMELDVPPGPERDNRK